MRQTLRDRVIHHAAQAGVFALLLGGAILAVVAAIGWGALVAGLAYLVGIHEVPADFLIGLVGGILGIFPTVKAVLWVRARLGRPRERSVEEMTEVF